MTTKPALTVAGIAIVFATVAASGLGSAQQQALPAPPNATVVTISPRTGSFNEPSIAINPKNPNQIAAAFQSPAKVAYSVDAGAHWEVAAGTSPANYQVSGDVSITYDILGHAILAYIAFDKLGTEQYWAHNATRNGVFVRRSLDGGKTWEADAAPVDEQATRAGMPFEDKPYLIADTNPESPYSGNLYIGWTEFSLSKSIMLFSRSTDGGITWSPPYEISTHEGIPRDDNGAVEGFHAVAGPDGTLYTIWADGDGIIMAISRDGGLTFSPSQKILDVPASYFKVEGVQRSDGFPQIDADPRTERLFITWADYRNGDVDVFCSTSRDRARTWSQPVRVNNDPLHDGADQFLPWMTVDPSDGAAYVVFYDRRGDPENQNATIVLARSTDGGQTFTNFAWTDTPWDPGDLFIGDYSGIAAMNRRVYGVWAYGEAPANPGRPRSTAQNRSRAIRTPKRPTATVVSLGVADFQPSTK